MFQFNVITIFLPHADAFKIDINVKYLPDKLVDSNFRRCFSFTACS